MLLLDLKPLVGIYFLLVFFFSYIKLKQTFMLRGGLILTSPYMKDTSLGGSPAPPFLYLFKRRNIMNNEQKKKIIELAGCLPKKQSNLVSSSSTKDKEIEQLKAHYEGQLQAMISKYNKLLQDTNAAGSASGQEIANLREENKDLKDTILFLKAKGISTNSKKTTELSDADSGEYTVEELELPENKDLLEKVLDANRTIDVEESIWYEGILEDYLEPYLTAIGFENPEINFTGFYSQGDGASFTAELDNEKFIASEKFKEMPKELQEAFITMQEDLIVRVSRISHHYSHENTVSAVVELTDTEPYTEEIVAKVDDLDTYFTKLKDELCDYIYTALEKSYDYLTSDESVLETLRVNNYEFNEDGIII